MFSNKPKLMFLKNKISFLEIGYERTSLIIYEENKLKLIQTIPIGGEHITSDISKDFKPLMNKNVMYYKIC